MEMSFTHLLPHEFEGLCYDLLQALGAEKLNWRKGSPGPSSPSDQGRDIECIFPCRTVGGDTFAERRFVECKHYNSAVPPRELAGALAWASSERPDVLQLMVSGFLSNPAKEHLESFIRNNRPPFRIIVWERPQLETYLARNSRLLRKYRLAPIIPQADLLHPLHIRYLAERRIFGLDTLFRVLDQLSPSEREDFIGDVVYLILQPRYRPPRIGNESYAELLADRVDYETFREKCYRVPVEELFLAAAIVDYSLGVSFRHADISRSDEIKDTIQGFIAFCKRRMEEEGSDQTRLQEIIERNMRELDEVDERLEHNRQRYELFCERVLLPLLESPPEDMSLQPEFTQFSD